MLRNDSHLTRAYTHKHTHTHTLTTPWRSSVARSLNVGLLRSNERAPTCRFRATERLLKEEHVLGLLRKHVCM